MSAESAEHEVLRRKAKTFYNVRFAEISGRTILYI
jgi:hypothetical protein